MKPIYLLPLTCLVIAAFIITASSESPTNNQSESATLPTEVPDLPVEEKETVNILFGSADGGLTWNDMSAGLPKSVWVSSAFAKDGVFFLGTQNGYLYHSLNPGNGSWVTEGIGGITDYQQITGIFPGSSGTYVCIYGVGLFRKSFTTGEWQHLSQNLEGPVVHDVVENQQGHILVSGPGGIYKSKDDGKSWKPVFTKGWISAMASENGALVASGPEGIMHSTDEGETWKYTFLDKDAVYDFKVIEDEFLAIRVASSWRTSDSQEAQNIYTSSDGGATWQHPDGLLQEQPIYEFEQVGESLFYCNPDGISRSTDGGKTWQLVHEATVTSQMRQYDIVVSGDQIFAVVKFVGC